MRTTGSRLLVEGLRAEGVEALFAIADLSYTPVLQDALDAGMTVVGGRHESAEMHMADAWFRASGRVAVAMAGMGPGVANLVPGVVNAWIEGIPVVVLATQRTARAHQAVRRNRFQYTPQLDVLRPVTKYAATIPDARHIPQYLREAFRHALTGRPGPVYLELYPETLREQTDDVSAMPPARYRTMPTAPDPARVEAAAELLADAERPLVLAGMGVHHAEASTELVRLAETVGAAVATTPGARGAISEEHPLSVGMASPLVSRATLEADVVVAAGTAIGEIVGYGLPPEWGDPAGQRLVHLDADPLVIGVNRPVDVALVGDTRLGLAALAAARERRSPRPRDDWAREQAAGVRALHAALVEGYMAIDATPIHPGRLAAELWRLVPEGAVMCLDGGNTAVWGQLLGTVRRPRSLLWTGHFGHLGTGLPYAIGAKLARPDAPVYLLSGDGAFGFNLQELETAARAGADVVAVVSCDFAWAMEEDAMVREIGASPGVRTSPVRYDRVCAALGGHGELVEHVDELGPALTRAVASGRPAVVQVVVDHDANVTPPGMAEFLAMYDAADS